MASSPTTPSSTYSRVKTPVVPQIETGECGAAALATILNYYGIPAALDEVRPRCGVSRDGSRASAMLEAAASYGLVGRGYSLSLEELRSRRPPMILHWRFNHFVVLEGIDERWGWINDPASGRARIPLEEIDRCFTGVALVFDPLPGACGTATVSRNRLLMFLPRLLSQWRSFLLVVSCGILAAAAVISFSFAYRRFIDHVYSTDPAGGAPVALFIIMLGILAGALAFTRDAVTAAVERKAVEAFGLTAARRLLRQPVEFFDKRVPAEVATRVDASTRATRVLTRFATDLTFTMAFSLVLCVTLLFFKPVLAAMALAGAVVNLAALWGMSVAVKGKASQARRGMGRLTAVTSEVVDALDSIQAAGAEGRAFDRWAGVYAATAESSTGVERAAAVGRAVGILTSSLTAAVFLTLGVSMMLDGTLSIGTLLALQSLACFLLAPMGRLVSSGGEAFDARGELGRMGDLLRGAAAARHERSGCVCPAGGQGAVLGGQHGMPLLELRRVGYRYGLRSEPIVNDVSLSVGRGRKVAVVGSSGSGKTTLAKIAAGLLSPWSGAALLDGRPLRAGNTFDLVSYVGQDTILFEGSVMDNIRMCRGDISEEIAMRAARDALAHEFVTARRDGYETKVEPDGANFSGGEAQRIDIARALASTPALLILDEATGYLDRETERRLFDNIRSRGTAVLVISQRMETVADSDEIVVVEKGSVVQAGRHEELVSRDGPYKTLMARGGG